MDLRSVLNTSDAGERPPSHEPPTPQQQPQPPPPPRPSPSAVQYAFHNYAQPPPDPPAPAKEHGQEYSSQAQRHASNTFPPPSPYQGSGTYPPHSSAAPPAHLSHPSGSFHDVLSPTSKTAQVPSQSPYRSSLTPNSAHTKAPAYPFPSQDVASPSQQPQFPSGQGHYHQLQQRQGSVSLPLSTKPSGPYVQHSTVPHTTGAGTSGCSPSYPYHHTRSQSTSVSAQSAAEIQRPLGPSHGHGSPMDASQQPPSAEFERQRSQPPPIPIGSSHPTAGLRHTSAAGETGQSSSPCSQRSPFTGVAQPILAQPIAAITSPSSPTMPLPIQRLSGALGACDSPTSDPHSRPRSHQDRDRSDRNSVSVSPRTRLASLSSNTGRPSVSGAETDSGKPSPGLQSMSIDLENAVTPAKRKLADRSMSPRELDRHESRPAPGETEDSSMGRIPMTAPRSAVRRTGRRPYAQPPIWAQSARILAGKMPKHPNFVLQTRAHQQLPLSNGTQDGHGKQETLSRPSSPEAGRSRQGEGDSQSQGPQAILETGPQSILGPWEASIMGVKPYEELSKTVADFIFINVVTNNDFKEIISRGIQFEIEAKLGTLIDKDTNVRVDKLLDTECILHDTGRIAFRSSTTEVRDTAAYRPTPNPSPFFFNCSPTQLHHNFFTFLCFTYTFAQSSLTRTGGCICLTCRRTTRPLMTF